MFSQIFSVGLIGLDSYIIQVETDISNGMPIFDLVGLPDAAVKESRNRVSSALKNSGFELPFYKITINLAPAHIKKIGSVYDLPILMGILISSQQIEADLDDAVFIGELSLKGDLRQINGVLPALLAAKDAGFKYAFVPEENAYEGAIIDGITVFGAKNVNEIIRHISGFELIKAVEKREKNIENDNFQLDFADVMGQNLAKRALEIAASGGHNVLLIGPPGSGKSMLAKRIPSILPDMTYDEIIETTKVHSVAGLLSKDNPLISSRPFRSPHHTVSPAGLSGGGAIPKPGEISLAHNGVLFLDEFPEFSRNSLEILRQPIEDNIVTISRVAASLSYPCSFMLTCAMNPCPCGFFGSEKHSCTCSKMSVSKYLSKISGPILDRLDLHVEVMPSDFDQLSSSHKEENSQKIKERVNFARKIQNERFKGTKISCNAKITTDSLLKFCPLTDSAKKVFKGAFDKLGLSARAYDRLLKVSRTIADLDNAEIIDTKHIAEAIQYRSLDRKYWKND